MTRIVVITPVKNDAWILHRFLSVTSAFADVIIISDQASNDGSRDIYKSYPKVIIIDNLSEEYNEATRQIQLIKKARELVPGKKIILTLDADEILVANYKSTDSWKRMLEAQPGTVLYFEKPDLQGTTKKAIRYFKAEYPMGMVEDYPAEADAFYLLRGFQSKGHKILDRNLRQELIDLSKYKALHLEDPLFLHYAHTRLDIQSSKMRLYSVIETVLYGRSLKNILIRHRKYNPSPDYKQLGSIGDSDDVWFKEWEAKGIDMHTIEQQEGLYWRDLEVLKYFSKYSAEYFKYEDIWDTDWEALRRKAVAKNIPEVPQHEIRSPNYILRLLTKAIYSIYIMLKKILS